MIGKNPRQDNARHHFLPGHNASGGAAIDSQHGEPRARLVPREHAEQGKSSGIAPDRNSRCLTHEVTPGNHLRRPSGIALHTDRENLRARCGETPEQLGRHPSRKT